MASNNTASLLPSQQVQNPRYPLSIQLSHLPSHLRPHRSHPAKGQPTRALLLQIPVSAFHPCVISTLHLHSQNLLWEIDPRQGVRRSRKSASENPEPHDLKKSHLWVWQDGSAGKGRCIQARGSTLDSYKAHDPQRK